jgi:hypothetical protein
MTPLLTISSAEPIRIINVASSENDHRYWRVEAGWPERLEFFDNEDRD